MVSDISLKDIPLRSQLPKGRATRVRSDRELFAHRTVMGYAGSVAIALVARRKQALTADGAAAAVGVGTITTGFGGYRRALLLIAFFTTSTVLSRIGRERKQSIADQAEKGNTRDARQVLANGGVSTAIAMIDSESDGSHPYVGALAAVTADTWATEIGGLSGSRPRHILTFRPIATGSSGGVTLLGTLASVAGGAFIGSLAALTRPLDPTRGAEPAALVATGIAAGFAGSIVDSVLGATVQERWWCPACRVSTERRIHRCGQPTQLVGGVRGIDNDVVNLLCSATGALVGCLIERVVYRGEAPRR